MDTFRDAGFVQGFLDGNWFGDPGIGGAWRYYPPLIHALFAGAAAMTGISPLRLLIAAAPWVNLVVPLGFFLMCRSLAGAPAAVFGTALLVIFNGWVLPPWVSAAYHPWFSVPLLALGAFFFSAWLIHARIRSQSIGDAVLIGAAVGLTFLAHTVPALILAAMLPVAVLAVRGPKLATLAWLAIAGVVTLAFSLPLLLPLIAAYRLHVLNASPGAFADPLFVGWPPSRGLLLTLLPGVIGLPLVVVLRREAVVSRAAGAMLAVWIAVPALFLTRHYACGPASHATVCTTFVLAVHHWFIYLQAALTCIAGMALWLCVRRALRTRARPVTWAIVGGTAAAIGAALLWLRPIDGAMRVRAQDLERHFDAGTYAWVAEHSAPQDLFVTELPDASLNPASLAVMAAGRRSVALPRTYSNPYVEWEPRNARNLEYLAAASGTTGSAAALCNLVSEAGASAYVILSNGHTAAPGLLPEFAGEANTIYRLTPAACGSAARDPAAPPPARQHLIGAWRLVAIDTVGPRGETRDPFYQAGSQGIIIYDASGWMSVQISAPRRRAFKVPETRVPRAAGTDDPLKVEAFNTYYSYFGTWDYDAATAVVTHHLASSVIPAETGMSYAQSVAFEGDRLIFTARSSDAGGTTVRRKVWEKLARPTP